MDRFEKNKNELKTKNGKKHILAAIFTLAVFLFIGLNCGIIFGISANYNEIYDMPRTVGGAADYSGFSFEGRNTKPTLSGEWEFFYNEWIVSDELNHAVPDCIINIPGKWTGTKIDGSKISADGYASYRMTLKNVPAGIKINIRIPAKNALVWRSFINGKLNNSCGTLSKEKNKSLTNGHNAFISDYIPQTVEDITIVIEVGNTGLGGLTAPPKLSLLNNTDGQAATTKYALIEQVPFVIFGVMLTLVIMQLVMSLALYGKKKELTGFFLVAALFFHFIFSKDMFQYVANIIISIKPLIFYLFNFFTAFAALAAFTFHLYRMQLVKIKKPFLPIVLAAFGIEYLLIFLLAGSNFQFIPQIMMLLTAGFIIYRLSLILADKKHKPKVFPLVYMIIFTGLVLLLALEGMDFMGWVVYGAETVASYVLLVSMIALSIIYLVKMRQNTRLALQAVEWQNDYNQMKHTAMRGQIKPHFIFNSLTSIQDQYHKGTKEGDAALTLFSKHLRLNTDADMKDLIPFEDELVNINNYFSLENLRFGGNLTLLFDIEYTEFLVPILGLQPLIENAVKYAATDKMPDGFIKISASKQGDKIILIIKDNGKGFDPADIKENSQGLKNVTARFAYYLSATTCISSKPNEGTEIQIIIPLKKEEV